MSERLILVSEAEYEQLFKNSTALDKPEQKEEAEVVENVTRLQKNKNEVFVTIFLLNTSILHSISMHSDRWRKYVVHT